MSYFEGEISAFPLASWTSWHIGGKAERFYCPAQVEALSKYLSTFSEIPITWLGLGSNVLIRDGGIPGSVICTRQLNSLYQDENGFIVAQAGVTCAKFARFCCQRGLAEAVFFAGIPGTIGGALAMNAGAFGGETWEWVKEVKVIDRDGKISTRLSDEFNIGYRSVTGKQDQQQTEAFVEGKFSFSEQSPDGLAKIKKLLRTRAESQPIGTFNCGSVYRNPPGDFAARLIEGCDLKGYKVGDVMISPKHANFILNCGQAKAQDVESVMSTIEACVLDRFGIQLHKEVRILGIKE